MPRKSQTEQQNKPKKKRYERIEPDAAEVPQITAAFWVYLRMWRENSPNGKLSEQEIPIVIASFKRHYGLFLSRKEYALLAQFERQNPPLPTANHRQPPARPGGNRKQSAA